MSDEFDRRDWVEDLNEGIRNRNTWFRGLKIVVLLLFLAIARFALLIGIAYQFCFCLVRNRPSEIMLPAGRWLAHYVEKIILFVTWNSDHAPFPFAPLGEVMEREPEYRDEETVFHARDESSAGEEEQYAPESPAPPPAEETAAPDDATDGEEPEGEPGDGEDQSKPPPRPDA